MAIKIGNASIDENDKISGGKLGDQTTREICIREWYNKPWNVYLECTDSVLAKKAAEWMKNICENKNFGYDQNERWTGYNSIKNNGFKLDGAKGEFDCSSLVLSCYIFAGLKISPDGYTGNLKDKLLKSGMFVAYTDATHLLNDSQAKRGGIYLKEGSHVVMALEDSPIQHSTPIDTITVNSIPKDINWLKSHLNAVVGGKYYTLELNGVYDNRTRIAVLILWESKGWNKEGLDDGWKVGKSTIKELNK